MITRVLLVFVFLFFFGSLFGQPLLEHVLAPSFELSKGRSFKAIEEISQVLVRGVRAVPHRVEMQFNSNGLIESRVVLNSAGGRTSETAWEYIDGKRFHKKTHRFFVNMIGWRDEVVTVDWDQETRLPERIEIFKEGKVFQWAIVVSDTLGRIESAKVFASNGSHVFNERVMHLESSNMIRVMVYRANGAFVGNWTYPIDPSKEFTYESVSRQFYPNGDLMTETLTDAARGDQAYFYEYEYDSQGNWVVKETSQVTIGRNNRIRNKRLEHKTTRRISYH